MEDIDISLKLVRGIREAAPHAAAVERKDSAALGTASVEWQSLHGAVS